MIQGNEGGRYKLQFRESALKEWHKLNPKLRSYFKKKLEKILDNPGICGSKLRGHPDRYKIKLRQDGYRLICEVQDEQIIVIVIAVERRDRIYADKD